MTASARAAHMYVIGMSGRGKSKLLEYCLYQDIAARRGCGLIDPHSLLVDDLLRLLITRGVLANPDIRDRLIYVDPARTDYVIPFDVLATVAEHPYDIAAAVLEAFRRTWPELCWPNNTSVLGGLLCNHYEGSCKVTRDSLGVSDVFATQMGCLEPEGILDQETAYFTALRTAATYQITADWLETFDEAGA